MTPTTVRREARHVPTLRPSDPLILRPYFVWPSLLTLLAPAGLRAQRSHLTADLGFSRLAQPGIPTGSALALGGTFDAAGAAAWFRGTALATRAGADRWTGQALAIGSLAGPSGLNPRWDVAGLASNFAESNALAIVSGEAIARLRFGTSTRGGAVGGGVGTTSRQHAWDALVHVQGGAWYTVDADRFSLDLSAIRTHSAFGGSGTLQRQSRPVTYGDVGGSWQRDREGLSLGANGGFRAQTASGNEIDGWATINGAAWVTPNAAIVVSAGRTLPDVIRGVPHTTFLSVGLRFAVEPHLTVLRRSADPGGARVVIERERGDVRRIEVRAPGASRVELMADFTGWAPIVLERAGDAWRLERAISPGLHRIAVRVDGGAWLPPVNVPRGGDELGGAVGLVTVP